MEALWYRKTENNAIICELCPHFCSINSGKSGICKVRKNENGFLIAETYGVCSAIHTDPIEKKPLYHFYPGSQILSVGNFGCNFTCNFCQNASISQIEAGFELPKTNYSPLELVEAAKQIKGNIGIAFTYNEPTVSFEYMLDTFKEAKAAGLKTAVITNGYINPKPLEQLIPFTDAFNVDLKAYNNRFYRKNTSGSLLPVLETISTLKNNNIYFEITFLLIPGQNDNIVEFENMIDFIATEWGNDTVLHISRYFPRYKSTIETTPDDLILKFYSIAKQKLNWVYLGNFANIDIYHYTICYNCKNVLIERKNYKTTIKAITTKNECEFCSTKINIIN